MACLRLVGDVGGEGALPPSSAIIATVRSASCDLRSTASTRVPARASRIAAARPLPMPSSGGAAARDDRDLPGEAEVVFRSRVAHAAGLLLSGRSQKI